MMRLLAFDFRRMERALDIAGRVHVRSVPAGLPGNAAHVL